MEILSTSETLIALLLGYVLGSIPFGLLLTKAAGLGDVRSIGSGNIGATNVLRTGNKPLAAATLAGDLLKGTFAVLLATWMFGTAYALIAGLGAFIGHIAPVWLKFRGGKGVATYIGVLAGWWWPAALLFAGVWIAIAYLTRFSSLSALIASIVVLLVIIALALKFEAVIAVVMTGLLYYMHRANIRRLLKGEEPKIGKAS